MYKTSILDLLKSENLNINEWFKKNYHTLREKDVSGSNMLLNMQKDYIVQYKNEIEKLRNMNKKDKIKFATNDKNNKIETWNNRINSITNDDIPKLELAKQNLYNKLNKTNNKYIKEKINIAVNEIEDSLDSCSFAIKNYKKNLEDIKLYSIDDIVDNRILIYEKMIKDEEDDIEKTLKTINYYKEYNEKINIENINKEVDELFKD